MVHVFFDSEEKEHDFDNDLNCLSEDLVNLVAFKILNVSDEEVEEILLNERLKTVLYNYAAFQQSRDLKFSVKSLLAWCSHQVPAVFLEKLVIDVAQNVELSKSCSGVNVVYEKAYLSEVPPAVRLEQVPVCISDQLRTALSKFKFRVKEEPNLMVSYEDFLSRLRAAQNMDFSKIELQEAQVLRWGIVQYFENLMKQLSAEDDRADKLLDFLSGFIVYFSDPQNESIILDLRMSKSLEESLWFLNSFFTKDTARDESIDAFGFAAFEVAEVYMRKQRSADEPKHPNQLNFKERASAFEHFMAVSRYALGGVDSLFINSMLSSNALLSALIARSDYQIEIIYTALLHDVIEDVDKRSGEPMMSLEVVKELLGRANLDKDLTDRICHNLSFLNAKRPDKEACITIAAYAQAVIDSENPVLLLVKYSDIIHNSHSETKSKWERDTLGNVTGNLSELWIAKQRAYDAIIKKVALENPVHVRAEDLIKIVSANPELFQFLGWKRLLENHPHKNLIFKSLRAETVERVKSMMAQSA